MNEARRVRALVAALRRARRHPFPLTGRTLECPPEHGVYLIIDRVGRVAHVGRTTRTGLGLLDRLRAHLNGQSSFVVQGLKKRRELLRKGYSYCWVEVRNPRLRALVEAMATGVFCPKHLGTSAIAS
jgi:hypothetical protein